MKDSPAQIAPAETAVGRPTATARRLVYASVSANTRRAYAGALGQLDTWLDGLRIAIGYGAGRNSLTGTNNVYIGNAGVRDEEGTIRIGTEGVHNRIYLAGEIHLAGGGVAAVYQ